MGLCMSRIHFENGIPPLDKIKDQFRIQTGLELVVKTGDTKVDILNTEVGYRFHVPHFSDIEYYAEENTIEILYGVAAYYYPTSLNKCFHDLGGRFVDSKNKPIKGWEWPKTWKKLKHWDEYKWYNTPKR